jgi:hypothetical protein
MGIDSDLDYSKKGAGGERGLVNAVRKYMSDDFKWWSELDVKNCFASLKPAHFGRLPIPALARKVTGLNAAFRLVAMSQSPAQTKRHGPRANIS